MDPSQTRLAKMLIDEITPVVMVLTTPQVEQSCTKNNLSFVDMLRPFCSFNNIDVPVRTASETPYRIRKFKLRLFYASDVKQPDSEVAKERIKDVIARADEKDFTELGSEPPSTDDLLKSSQSELLPTWFDFFNKQLVRSLSFSDHEAFDHPVACLLAVSSNEDQPINRFVDLFNTDKLPSLLNDGLMDPKILKHYVLVHDIQDGPSEKAMKILTEMRSTFGPNDCHLLCINSEDGPVEHQDNPWISYRSDVSYERCGSFLSTDDSSEMKELVQGLSSKRIIPHMEQKIRALNQQVSATRKGFKNQIKNLWWRKGKEETADAHNGSLYTFSSTESQIRVLADYAFMLRDYELALSNYRLVSTDYKLDKAWKHYAGVQEMMGLSYFMLDQLSKEAEYCMENAFTTYLKMGPSGQQNATRCGLWWVEMLKAKGQYKEAASVYFRICGEELLHSAVMLEQASYCYLLSRPPMLYKYGFHLVLSGDRYRRCDQVKHAIRTYRRAVSVYKDTTWSHIKDHVHFLIGQWYALLGMHDVAVTHMLEVLSCSHQSQTTQELFLREFVEIIQNTGKTFEVMKLQLPVVNISSLAVVFEDQRTYASPAAAAVSESSWFSLEEDVIPSLSSAKSNWLELQSKLVPKKLKESNLCIAGEAIKVNIEFKNPLQIPISISAASLICELTSRTDETPLDACSSTEAPLVDEEPNKAVTSRDTSSDMPTFILSEVDFSLGGSETIMVQLTVTPRVEGNLRIVGVRWKLSSFVVGVVKFESDYAMRKPSKGRRKGKGFSGDTLKFTVIKSIPRLQGSIRTLPEKAYAGDLRHLILELRNESEFPVKNLKMKISHPRFLNIGNPESLDVEFPACLEKKANSRQSNVLHHSTKESDDVFHFPENTLIQRDTPFLWPLWFRAATPGNISLYITVYYEIGDISSVMRFRTLRMYYSLQVLPSLDVSFQVSPCFSRLQDFLVRMDIYNRTSSEVFQLLQLSTIGQQEISLLQPLDDIFPSQSLLSGQGLSCFFMLKDGKKSLHSEGQISSSCFGRDVKLGNHCSNEPFYDISRSPLTNFHHYERSQQKMPDQELPYTVDLILMSRPMKSQSNSSVLDEPFLFSHHASHCSISGTSPISWLLDGPRIIYHDFSASFCEINLKMTIYNSSNATASVRTNTFDPTNCSDSINSSVNGTGWQNISVVNDIKVTSDVGSRVGSTRTEYVAPFVWSGSSSTTVHVQPMSATEIPLQISVFSPGIHDLSNYVLHWGILSSSDDGHHVDPSQSSGTCKGYPYHITVLPPV